MNGLSTINWMNKEACDNFDKRMMDELDKRVVARREKTLTFLKWKTIASVVLVESEEKYEPEDVDTLTLFFTDGTKIEISAVSECDNANLVLEEGA
ncbi:hypothetical protein LCGC14_2708970 [marine sediment metagenome]|uniref:Uncharacterized protein n=1 Tax=marine sediment metagenome TaxID=412755 RepID=A0A0F9A155_9ZZZZ